MDVQQDQEGAHKGTGGETSPDISKHGGSWSPDWGNTYSISGEQNTDTSPRQEIESGKGKYDTVN